MSASAVQNGRFLGLISGTSADGVDAALLRFDPTDASGRCRLEVEASHTYAYPASLRERLLPLIHGQRMAEVDEIGQLDAELGLQFGQAALTLLRDGNIDPASISAIGSHGQTIRHRPRAALPFTWQIADPSRIVEMTGITTVADFRRRDVAAGGQGAPLVPAFHAAVLADPSEDRAVLNMGGIANLTLLPRDGSVRGFDCGPANGLLDLWAQRCGLGERDEGGATAARGRSDPALLARLLDEPWFRLPPPKSTGREDFNADWLDARLGDQRDPATVMASLVALTAHSTAQALRATLPACRRLLLCGGGIHNPSLLGALAEALPGVLLESTARYGLAPDFVEAAAFAWLARQCLLQRPGALASVTGASADRVLGAVHFR